MTQEELKISINIGAETAEEAVKSLKGQIEKLGGSVEDLDKKTGKAAQEQLAFAAASAAAFASLLGVINKSTQAITSYQSAMKGLESVAGGRGVAQSELQEALDSVTDGFFSATAAATAYKNLLTRGYSLDQATNAIVRLKDAAAFGRQASLSLEDAVVSTTEGLRNENSVLVDNAGVTKNVAKMWEDYAKARGLVTANLTQEQKVEAEYIGLMQETQMQVGDLAKASETLAGSQAEQAAQITKLSTAYGSALEPAVKGVTEAITRFLGIATDVVEAAPGMASGITTAVVAFTGLAAVIMAVKSATEKLTVAALKNPFTIGAAIVSVAVGTLAAHFTNLAEAEARAAEEEKKRAEQSKERSSKLTNLREEEEELETLKKRYQELTTVQNKSDEDLQELQGIVQTLNTEYGIQVTALNNLDDAYKQGQTAIENRILALDQESKALVRLELEYQKQQLREAQAASDAAKEGVWGDILSSTPYEDTTGAGLGMQKAFDELEAWADEVEEYSADIAEQMKGAMSVIFDSLQEGEFTEEQKSQTISDLYEYFQSLAQAYVDGLDQTVLDYEEAVQAMEDYLSGNEGALDEYLAKLRDSAQTEGTFDGLTDGAEDVADEVDAITQACTGMEKKLKTIKDKLDWKRELLDDRRAMKQAVDVLVDGGEVTEEWAKAVENTREQFGGLSDIELQSALGAEIASLEQETDGLNSQLNATIAEANQLMADIAAGAYGEITLDNQAAIDAIAEVIATLSAAGLSVEDISPTAKKGGGGGGGGKSKAEEAAEEAKRLQEEQYRAQLELIEHKRRMDQITAEEELELLIMVRNTYAQTADQIQEMDEKIYEARKALREAEEDQLTELHEAVMDALEARYEAQREAEQKRIEESIEQWETWADETTSAIQKQIDALDEKAEAEDREATAAEKLRAIDKIKQQMIYETDEYNLRQLQKQLDKAEADLTETQADWAREDQKKALQEQMDAIEQQAQTQIDALDKESEAIDEYYDKLTEKARLEAEAQEIMMRESQENIIAMLKEYAPDYEVVGKSFGEKFYDGFVSVLGDIGKWFDSFAAAMEAPLVSAAQYATRSAQAQISGQSVKNGATVTQNVTFNVPVETPTDTARKMQQVNEALAAML